jgi:circadian clock protein KaiC
VAKRKVREGASDPSRVKFGISGLDEILDGGLSPRHLYLVDGDPGTGKTTVGVHFLMEGRNQGERGM